MSEENIKRKRDVGIDLIRVIACILVVGTHVDVMGTGDSTKLFIRLLFSDGVTLFFILSGFFFFRKGFKDTLKRSLSSIILPGIVVMLLSYQFSSFIRNENTFLYCMTHLNFGVFHFLTDMFSWGGNIREAMAAHLWYIFTYLELVLAYPLLKPLYTKNMDSPDRNVDKALSHNQKEGALVYNTAEKAGSGCGQTDADKESHKTYNRQGEGIITKDRFRKYRWFIIAFIFINQIIMDLNMTGLIGFSPVQISPFMLYTAPAMLLMIGAEIGSLRVCLEKTEFSYRKKQLRITALVVLAVSFTLRFLLQKLVFSLNDTQDFFLYWNCAFATVQGTSFVIFILGFDYRNNKVASFIARAGRYTFWIYLLHYGIYYSIYFRKGPDWSLGLIDLTNGYDTISKELLHILIRVPTIFLLSLIASFLIEMIRSKLKNRAGNKKI